MRDTIPVEKGTITPNTCNSMSLNREFKLVEVKRCWQSHNLWSCSTLFGTMRDNTIRSHIMTGKYVVRFVFLFCCGLNNCHNDKMMIMVMLMMMMKIIKKIIKDINHVNNNDNNSQCKIFYTALVIYRTWFSVCNYSVTADGHAGILKPCFNMGIIFSCIGILVIKIRRP